MEDGRLPSESMPRRPGSSSSSFIPGASVRRNSKSRHSGENHRRGLPHLSRKGDRSTFALPVNKESHHKKGKGLHRRTPTLDTASESSLTAAETASWNDTLPSHSNPCHSDGQQLQQQQSSSSLSSSSAARCHYRHAPPPSRRTADPEGMYFGGRHSHHSASSASADEFLDKHQQRQEEEMCKQLFTSCMNDDDDNGDGDAATFHTGPVDVDEGKPIVDLDDSIVSQYYTSTYDTVHWNSLKSRRVRDDTDRNHDSFQSSVGQMQDEDDSEGVEWVLEEELPDGSDVDYDYDRILVGYQIGFEPEVVDKLDESQGRNTTRRGKDVVFCLTCEQAKCTCEHLWV